MHLVGSPCQLSNKSFALGSFLSIATTQTSPVISSHVARETLVLHFCICFDCKIKYVYTKKKNNLKSPHLWATIYHLKKFIYSPESHFFQTQKWKNPRLSFKIIYSSQNIIYGRHLRCCRIIYGSANRG